MRSGGARRGRRRPHRRHRPGCRRCRAHGPWCRSRRRRKPRLLAAVRLLLVGRVVVRLLRVRRRAVVAFRGGPQLQDGGGRLRLGPAVLRRLLDPPDDLVVVVRLERLEDEQVGVLGQAAQGHRELLELPGRDLGAVRRPRDLGRCLGDLLAVHVQRGGQLRLVDLDGPAGHGLRHHGGDGVVGGQGDLDLHGGGVVPLVGHLEVHRGEAALGGLSLRLDGDVGVRGRGQQQDGRRGQPAGDGEAAGHREAAGTA